VAPVRSRPVADLGMSLIRAETTTLRYAVNALGIRIECLRKFTNLLQDERICLVAAWWDLVESKRGLVIDVGRVARGSRSRLMRLAPAFHTSEAAVQLSWRLGRILG
jgi:hypothetical protein